MDENFPEEDKLVKDDFCCEHWQNGLSDEENIANFKKYLKKYRKAIGEEEAMREKLNKSEIQSLNSVMDRIDKLYKHFEDKDVVLHYGNHSVATQLSCALAALETILQEY